MTTGWGLSWRRLALRGPIDWLPAVDGPVVLHECACCLSAVGGHCLPLLSSPLLQAVFLLCLSSWFSQAYMCVSLNLLRLVTKSLTFSKTVWLDCSGFSDIFSSLPANFFVVVGKTFSALFFFSFSGVRCFLFFLLFLFIIKLHLTVVFFFTH